MIRTILQDDLKQITNLFVKVFNNAPRNDSWTFETAARRLSDIINTPGFYGMAKYVDNKLIGLIIGRSEQYFDGEYFQIVEFCIDTDKQRLGLGKELLAEFMTKLKQRNIVNVFLITARGHATEGFYQKNGFETSSDMILMSKRLD